MRAFLCLDLPDAIADRLEHLMTGFGAGRVVPSEQYHITLAFLDDQPEAVLAELHDILDGWAVPQLALRLTGLGTFGEARPRLLYAAVQPDPGLAELRGRVRRACRSVGIVLPHERFVPHVTLARFRREEGAGAAAEIGAVLEKGAALFPSPEFTATTLCLYGSELRPTGARHTLLARYPDPMPEEH